MPRWGEIVRDTNGKPVYTSDTTVTERDAYGNLHDRTIPGGIATYGIFAWVTPQIGRWIFALIIGVPLFLYLFA